MGLSASLRQALRWLGIDRSVGFTVAGKVTQAGAGVVTLLLAGTMLTGVQQGFYFTFGSVLALQLFFELGFSWVVLHTASHERPLLDFDCIGLLVGDSDAKGRLSSLLRIALKWYTVSAVLMCVTVGPGGVWFFSRYEHAANHVNWRLPWALVVLFTASAMVVSPLLSFLEGCGEVAAVAKFRWSQTLLANTLLWIVLICHGGLYASATYAIVFSLMGFYWIRRRYGRLFTDLLQFESTAKIDWRDELWPFQWKMAVSWLSGYFIFYLFNPVLFAYRGELEAGRMGMTIAALSGILAVSMAWINTKAPLFGNLISQERFNDLDSVFKSATYRSIGVAVLGCVALIAFVIGAGCLHLKIATRFTQLTPLVLMSAGTIVNALISSMAVYLRSHKREPYLSSSVVLALLTAILVMGLVPRWGSVGAALAYSTVFVVVGLPIALIIFYRCRQEWHSYGPYSMHKIETEN